MEDLSECVRVGVVGPSWWFAYWHLPAIERHPAAAIVGVCGDRPRTPEEIRKRYGEHAVYFTDLDRFLTESKPDGIIICTPNDLHYPTAMAAMRRNIAVLVEKPIALDAATAWDLCEEWDASLVVGMVNFPYRFNPCVQKMRELILEGYLGHPLHIHATYHGGYGIGKAPGWRGDRRRSGSGILADLGSHLIDLCRFVLSREVTAVCAHNLTALWTENQSENQSAAPRLLHTEGGDESIGLRNDDSCAFLCEWDDGVQGVLHTSWLAYQGAEAQTQHLEVHGSAGRLRFYASHLGTHLEGTRSPGREWERIPVEGVVFPADATCDDEDYFRPNRLNEQSVTYQWLEAVSEGMAQTEPTLREGAKVQSVIDAVLRSSASRSWQSVLYPEEGEMAHPLG